MIGKLLCKLGLHKWQYNYEHFDINNTMISMKYKCKRCGEVIPYKGYNRNIL